MKVVTILVIGAVFGVQLCRSQEYGDSCKTALGENGMCVPSSQCALRDIEVESCSYSEFVCCHNRHTSTTNLYNQDKKKNNIKDDLDFDIPSENIHLPTEENLASSESSREGDLYVENRFRWPTRHKSIHHTDYHQRHNYYGLFKYPDSYHHPNGYRKPSVYHPYQNKPTENSLYYQHGSSDFDENRSEWQPRPSPALPVWGLEMSEETKMTGARRKRISQLKCEEFSRPVTQTVRAIPLSLDADVVPVTVQKCDLIAAKLIVGGVAAEVGEFPHMAAVGFRARDGSIMWNCGGSLISESHVMTAGHCTNTSFGNPVLVRLGEYNLAKDNDDAQPEDYEVEQVIPHPRYKANIKYNDIALLRLKNTVRLSDKIRPACLSSSESFTDKAIATGWGRTDFVGRVSDVLMKVGLSIIDNDRCDNIYKKDRTNARFFRQGITDSMLCAGELEGGKDTCFGDSGGPLQIVDEGNRCMYHIIGITSFGKVCGAANSPGVYTRVSTFLPWIEKTVWG